IFIYRCRKDNDLPIWKPFHCHHCDDYFESQWQREAHICSSEYEDISEGNLSDEEPFLSHPILLPQAFPISTNPFPRRSLLYDNPGCEGSVVAEL
ncbi:hypothetical protein AVEN_255957-1, partial [Araneus ventricosus]